MTSSQSDHLFLLKLFFNFAAMDRFFHGNLDDVLSRCTEFDHMEGKFIASKTSEISPRIKKLQDNLGFAPGESLTSSNLHRLIPAAREIHCIMGRHRDRSPVGDVEEKKTPTQPRFVPYFNGHKPKHVTNKKVLPAIRRIKHDWKNPLGFEDSSKLNMDFDSNSKKNFPTPNMNKSFDESILNKSLPYLNKNFSDSRSRKSWNVSKSNVESGYLNLKKGMKKRSMKDFSVPKWNTDICERTLNKEMDSRNTGTDFWKLSLIDDIGVPNTSISIEQLKTDIGAMILNKETDSSNSNIEFREFNVIEDISVPNASMDFGILNTKSYLPVSQLNKCSDASCINRNVLFSSKSFSVSKLNNFETQSFDSILFEDLEVSTDEDEKENFHEIVI